MEKPKALGYIRVSSDEQRTEGLSLPAQEAKILIYANLREIEIIGILKDEGISAKNVKSRPGAQELIQRACQKEVQAIIVYKLDRLFRNTIEALQIIEQFNKAGIDFHSIQENVSTKSAIGEFFFTMLAALAQMERKLIGERTRAVLAYKRENGQKTGGRVPYGYRVVEERMPGKDKPIKRLVEEAREQKYITYMRVWHRAGWTYKKIAQELQAASIPTRTGTLWSGRTVKAILDREGREGREN